MRTGACLVHSLTNDLPIHIGDYCETAMYVDDTVTKKKKTKLSKLTSLLSTKT